ncbi:MAG TPA: hypothetical protein VFZ66_10415 [Herpetosiphonaceae bacterium]
MMIAACLSLTMTHSTGSGTHCRCRATFNGSGGAWSRLRNAALVWIRVMRSGCCRAWAFGAAGARLTPPVAREVVLLAFYLRALHTAGQIDVEQPGQVPLSLRHCIRLGFLQRPQAYGTHAPGRAIAWVRGAKSGADSLRCCLVTAAF